jgi:hypothetical protein
VLNVVGVEDVEFAYGAGAVENVRMPEEIMVLNETGVVVVDGMVWLEVLTWATAVETKSGELAPVEKMPVERLGVGKTNTEDVLLVKLAPLESVNGRWPEAVGFDGAPVPDTFLVIIGVTPVPVGAVRLAGALVVLFAKYNPFDEVKGGRPEAETGFVAFKAGRVKFENPVGFANPDETPVDKCMA